MDVRMCACRCGSTNQTTSNAQIRWKCLRKSNEDNEEIIAISQSWTRRTKKRERKLWPIQNDLCCMQYFYYWVGFTLKPSINNIFFFFFFVSFSLQWFVFSHHFFFASFFSLSLRFFFLLSLFGNAKRSFNIFGLLESSVRSFNVSCYFSFTSLLLPLVLHFFPVLVFVVRVKWSRAFNEAIHETEEKCIFSFPPSSSFIGWQFDFCLFLFWHFLTFEEKGFFSRLPPRVFDHSLLSVHLYIKKLTFLSMFSVLSIT